MNSGNGGHLCDGPLCGVGDIVTVGIVDGKPVSGVEYYLHMAQRAEALLTTSNKEELCR